MELLPLTPRAFDIWKARFGSTKDSKPSLGPLYKPLSRSRKSSSSNRNGFSSDRLVGENRNLEKPYLRLTSFPKKEDVRPLEVLVKSLAYIKNRYIKDEDFVWANEQLKSVRQDLTVQRLSNPFVLEVYETHARILLEHGDLDEFNQCQTVIRSLVSGAIPAADDSVCGGGMSPKGTYEDSGPLSQSPDVADEFCAYGLLYALVRNAWAQLKIELARMDEELIGLKEDDVETSTVESSTLHALQVVKAVEANDYRTFFRLYENAPNMSAYLMDFLVKRVRDSAYERIVSAYRPTVSIEHVRDCLQLQDLEETRCFLRQQNAVFVEEKGGPFWIECKASKSSGGGSEWSSS